MDLNVRAIIKLSSLITCIIGLSMIPSIVVAIIFSERPALISLCIPCFFSTLMGYLFFIKIRISEKTLRMRDGFMIVTVSWIIAGLLGAVPFIISGSIPSFIDAVFESCSGFSTTGSSILTDVEVLPKSILFWRSFTHWLGGMGIVIFTIALLPSLEMNGQTIARAEVPGPTLDKLTPKMADTARALYMIYLLFTLIQILLLCLGGMSLYDSAIHTFGSVGTGGMSNYNDSVGHFGSIYINTVITVFMMLSSTNFNLYYLAIKNRKPGIIVKDDEFRFFILLFLLISVLIFLDLLKNGYPLCGKTASDSCFQVSSILTTSGFCSTNYELWPNFSKLLLFLLMFIGGCSGSTSGGIKVIRILVILKYIRRGISQRLHPKEISDVKINGKHVHSNTVSGIITHIFLFSIVVFLGTVLVSIDNHDMITNLTAVLSCVGNIGPGFNLVGPAENYSVFSDFSKAILSFLMIAGRLELMTVLLLFTPGYWNPNKK